MFDQDKTRKKSSEDDVEALRQAVLKWIDLKKEPQPVLKEKHQVVAPLAMSTVQQPNKNASNPRRQTHSTAFILIALIVFTAGLCLLGFGLCYYQWDNPAANVISSALPFPVAIANFQPIPYSLWREQVDSLDTYYHSLQATNADASVLSLPQIKKLVLNRLIDQTIISQLSDRYNLTVSADEISQETDSLVREMGSLQALLTQIRQLYNWDLHQFQTQIIEPVLLKNKLAVAVMLDDRINEVARQRIESIAEKLQQNPALFSTLAKQYSEDVTAAQGGDLGYFKAGEMVPEFEDAVQALKPGQISDIVKTRFGYHIIRLDEKIIDPQTGSTLYRASHILIRGKDIDTYVSEVRKSEQIWQLVRL